MPKKKKKQKQKKRKPWLVQTTIDKVYYEHLATAARREGISVAAYVRRMIMQWAGSGAT